MSWPMFGAPDSYHYDDTGAPEAVGNWVFDERFEQSPQGICVFFDGNITVDP
jgi:hypothetical protein